MHAQLAELVKEVLKNRGCSSLKVNNLQMKPTCLNVKNCNFYWENTCTKNLLLHTIAKVSANCGTVFINYLLESVSDKKDFAILVRDVDLNGSPPLKWRSDFLIEIPDQIYWKPTISYFNKKKNIRKNKENKKNYKLRLFFIAHF